MAGRPDWPCLDQPCDQPRYRFTSGTWASRCWDHLVPWRDAQVREWRAANPERVAAYRRAYRRGEKGSDPANRRPHGWTTQGDPCVRWVPGTPEHGPRHRVPKGWKSMCLPCLRQDELEKSRARSGTYWLSIIPARERPCERWWDLGCMESRQIDRAGRVQKVCQQHLTEAQTESLRRRREADPKRYRALKSAADGRRRPKRRVNSGKRRDRAAGVEIAVRFASSHCGVCRGPLDPSQRHGSGGHLNGLANSTGHGRFPLSRDPKVAYIRDEHWVCNRLMGKRSDRELDSAWWARWFREAYPILRVAGLAPEVSAFAHHQRVA